MIGRITSYLRNWWNNLASHQAAMFSTAVVMIIMLGTLYYLVPDKSPVKTLRDRLSILEAGSASLIADRAQLRIELESSKQQIHTLSQALITITTDVSALNDVINRNDLTIVYQQDVEDVRRQVAVNMKTIAESMMELTGGK